MENIHAFDIRLACRYGLDEAIIIGRLDSWLVKNKLRGVNFYDNTWWTCLTLDKFIQYFPYMRSQSNRPGRRIHYLLNKLKKEKVLRIECIRALNPDPRDTTNSYTFTTEFLQSSIPDEIGSPVAINTILRFATIEVDPLDVQNCTSDVHKCTSTRTKVFSQRNKNVPPTKKNRRSKQDRSKQKQNNNNNGGVVIENYHVLEIGKQIGVTPAFFQEIAVKHEIVSFQDMADAIAYYQVQQMTPESIRKLLRSGDPFFAGRCKYLPPNEKEEENSEPLDIGDLEAVWKAVLDRLEQRINRGSFNTWLRAPKTELLLLTHASCIIEVPDAIAQEQVAGYENEIIDALHEVLGHEVSVAFEVKKNGT